MPALATTMTAQAKSETCPIASMQRVRCGLPFVLGRDRVRGAGRHIAFDGRAQHVLKLGHVELLNSLLEPLERRDELVIGHDRLGVLENARVVGAGRVLADQKLLVELFATPETDIFDGDVAFGMVLVAHLETR